MTEFWLIIDANWTYDEQEELDQYCEAWMAANTSQVDEWRRKHGYES